MDKDVVFSIVVLLLLGTYVVAFQRRGVSSRALAKLASGVDAMRAMAERESVYVPLPNDDIPLPSASYYDAAAAEILKAGCRVLGDRAQRRVDGTLTAPTRWFVDPSGTICGWFGIVAPQSGAPVREVMFVFSEAPGPQYYSTGRGGAGSSTAYPPCQHTAQCRWADGLERQLEVQRGQTATVAAASLTRVSTLDDAIALLDRLRKAKADWRAMQPADALLDLDLKEILQDRYRAVGPALLAYMKNRRPAA